MTLALPHALTSVVASIPSPSVSYVDLGPLRIHFYALCIIAGIIVAVLLTNARLTRRGAEPWVVIDIALLAVPIAIIGARIFHVLTHPGFYFGEGTDPWAVFRIWEGGIAIFGALLGGAVGAYLGCRWTGIRFWTFADALAPGLLIAQALGRFGNWFNQELYGLPTDLPWGLEIDSDNAAFPIGLPADTLFHPTFLYEVIWNLLGAAVLLWAGRRFRLQWGRLFGLYLIWYGAGRIVWESIRIDPSEIFFGLRTNVWAVDHRRPRRHRDHGRAEASSPRLRAFPVRARESVVPGGGGTIGGHPRRLRRCERAARTRRRITRHRHKHSRR